jgi:hypothetical protein
MLTGRLEVVNIIEIQGYKQIFGEIIGKERKETACHTWDSVTKWRMRIRMTNSGQTKTILEFTGTDVTT